MGGSVSDSLIQIQGAICTAGKQRSGVPIAHQRLNPSYGYDHVFACGVKTLRGSEMAKKGRDYKTECLLGIGEGKKVRAGPGGTLRR